MMEKSATICVFERPFWHQTELLSESPNNSKYNFIGSTHDASYRMPCKYAYGVLSFVLFCIRSCHYGL